MSVDYNTYVGPYIQVYNPEKDSTEEYHSCPNSKCNNHKKDISAGYCSHCGSRIERMSRPCKNQIKFNVYEEFDNEIVEVLCEYKPKGRDDYQYFISNKSNDGLHLDGRYTSVNHIDCATPGMEIKNFNLKWEKEIKRLVKVFGAESVRVKWGVLVWCS